MVAFSESIIVDLIGGQFDADMSTGVTVNNLPIGLGISVTRATDTQISITFTGNAVNHTTFNNVNNASITIAQAKIARCNRDL